MSDQRITRRKALQTIGAFTAGSVAPYVITSTALGGKTSPPASDRITLGHIGVGGRGRDLFRSFQAVPGCQSVAVADCFEDRRTALAAICGGTAYRDFRELLGRKDIDAVVIATPDHWHVPMAILAARAGKSAYVEKPLGMSIEQNLACQTAFTRAGTVFQYGTQQRSMAHCHRACELVRRGAIGKVRAIEVDAPNGGAGGVTAKSNSPSGMDYKMWLGPAPDVPYTSDRCKPPGSYWIYDYSIGYLAGWGAHPLDLMVWACDADLSGPITARGKGVIPSGGLYDTVYNWDMRISLGDVDLVFRPGGDRTRFIGELGWIQVSRDRGRTSASDPALLTAALDRTKNQLPVSAHHQANFVEAVKRKDPRHAVSGLRDAVRSDVISHLCDIAVRTSEKVSWDPAKQELIGGNQQVRAMLRRPMRAPWTL